MLASSVTQKGQVTIPVAYREALDIQSGDKVVFIQHGNELIIKKKYNDPRKAFGLLKANHSMSLAEMEQAIAKGAANGNH